LPALSFAVAVIVCVPTLVGNVSGSIVHDSIPDRLSVALHVTDGNESPKSNCCSSLIPEMFTVGGVAS
jgi:hypothetical protein